MEHEVFVPFPAETIRQALSDPARVARSIPGLQQDAGAMAAEEFTGRLRLRVGGSTITYRGALRLSHRADCFALEAEATEARGTGTVKLGLEAGVVEAVGGSWLSFSGTVTADGRLGELDASVVATAGRRLLDRFAAELTAGLPAVEPDIVDDGAEAATGVAEVVGFDDDTEDTIDLPDGFSVPESAAELDPLESVLESLEPAVEAAHARRTLIGRSTEEVDHAPPRGRYAPVPAPDAASARQTLRWAAPAAAALLASAVVVRQMLRRRR
jgi:carbon monoxide dehydrogenase subunit G